MNCIRPAMRPGIRRFMVLGVMAVLPVTGAHAQTPTKATPAPTSSELASLASTGWVPSRGALTSEAFRELARPIRVEPRLFAPARQGGSQGSQQRGWVGRHPVLFGALVGVGPGVVFGEYELGRKGDMAHGPDMLIGAGIGAGTGSLVGLVVGLAR